MIAERQLIQELKHANADKLRDPDDAMKELTALHKENWTLLEDAPEDENNNGVDYSRYGWWGFRPQCLQFLSGVNGMLVLLFWFSFAQGTLVNGLVNTGISSIEKRYDLSSSKTGIVSIGYDIGNGTLVLLVTYWIRTRRAKVKAISLGALVLWAGAMVFSLPHFTVGLYNYGASVKATCQPDNNDTQSTCEEEETGLSNYMFLFLTGQILQGIGAIPIHTFGSDLLEASAPPNSGGLYLGLKDAAGALGPATGYLLNGKLLDIYVDFNKPGAVPPDGGPSDPRWLGAWWLGFPMFATVALLVSPWLAGLPGEFPDYVSLPTDTKKSKEEAEDKGFFNFFKEMTSFFKIPMLLCLTSASCGIAMSFNGLITFTVKYIENQFAQPAGWSAILAGMVLIPGGMGGALLGGLLMRRLQVGISGALKLAIAASIAMGVTSAAFLLRCDNINMAGVTSPYHQGPSPVPPIVGAEEVTSSCNLNCNCQTKYDPVCAPSGVEYFSPCVAGCTEKLPGESKSYAMCNCLPTNQSMANVSAELENKVTSGHCPNNCGLLPLVMCALFFYSVGMASMGPSMLFSTLRCVKESQRSMALGFQSLIGRFLGAIPGPIVYGSLIDRACLLWNESCDQRGACLMYDNTNLSTYFFTVTFILACWIFLSLCLALYSWKRSDMKLNEEKDAKLDEDARKRVSGILEIVSYRETTV
ncbi:SLCO4C1 [Branchiostoma lanceolatum]|uniref:Solute carrier organic anion transporter family member n=1 Tax=Branchiostoma lanceolatum TaxID=7740 RepID=A0A8J9W2R9_BRALA|nr:SLCO4C1 [Branchiostoma lanceolatum]